MTGYQQCQRCHRRTRGSVRMPMVGESYRVPACAEHKEFVRAKLAEQVSTELRLLAALFGGVHRMPRPPSVDLPILPGTEVPIGLKHKRVETVQTEVL